MTPVRVPVTPVRVPVTFATFCELLGVKLTLAQAILCAVAYDFAEPAMFRGKGEAEQIARTLFGDIETVPTSARGVALHLCGARGGKSYILCALRLLYLALTVPLDRLAPGELASALIVAPDLRLARQTYRYVRGACEHPRIAAQATDVTRESLTIQRACGRRVQIECLPATRGGSAVRARSLVGFALDEAAFFRNADFKINDDEIFRAVAPRVVAGGQGIIASTAWADTGLLWDLFSANWNHPQTCVAARCPTLLLNPSKAADVARERERDPVNAAREFDCEFMDSGASTFFSHKAVEDAVDKALVLPLSPPPGAQVMIGADTGFRRDSSALVVVYRLPDGSYVVAEVLELRPKQGQPLKPSEVVAAFAAACRRHGCSWLMADAHYRETLDEELAKEKLSYVPAPGGAEGKAECYMHAKTLLYQGRLRLPNNRRLLEQLKQTIGKPTSGGGLSLSSPRASTGGHGDLVSALVLAVSQRAGQIVVQEAPKVLTREEAIRTQTNAAWEKYEQRRADEIADQNDLEGLTDWMSA